MVRSLGVVSSMLASSAAFVLPGAPAQCHAATRCAEPVAVVGKVVPTGKPLLQINDEHFSDVLENSVCYPEGCEQTENLIIDFYAEFCGPCKLAEPALARLDSSSKPVRVVKAKADDSRMLRGWLTTHGHKVRALPTLVLVRNGQPVRTLMGADKILNANHLSAFALDDEPAAEAAAAPDGKELCCVSEDPTEAAEADSLLGRAEAILKRIGSPRMDAGAFF